MKTFNYVILPIYWKQLTLSWKGFRKPLVAVQMGFWKVLLTVLYVRHPLSYVRHPLSYVRHPLSYVCHPLSYVRHPLSYVRASLQNSVPLNKNKKYQLLESKERASDWYYFWPTLVFVGLYRTFKEHLSTNKLKISWDLPQTLKQGFFVTASQTCSFLLLISLHYSLNSSLS